MLHWFILLCNFNLLMNFFRERKNHNNPALIFCLPHPSEWRWTAFNYQPKEIHKCTFVELAYIEFKDRILSSTEAFDVFILTSNLFNLFYQIWSKRQGVYTSIIMTFHVALRFIYKIVDLEVALKFRLIKFNGQYITSLLPWYDLLLRKHSFATYKNQIKSLKMRFDKILSQSSYKHKKKKT